MKNILLLSFATLLSFNALADYKVYGSQKNSIPIPQKQGPFELKISFESNENHNNVDISGYIINQESISLSGRQVNPTDGAFIGTPYNPGGEFKRFYSYITFEVPDYVDAFDISFDYRATTGISNGESIREFKFQSSETQGGNFTTLNTLGSDNFDNYAWKTFHRNNINNYKYMYRIEAKVGTDRTSFGSPNYMAIDNIVIKEIISE